jgi:molybdate transport system permease protein
MTDDWQILLLTLQTASAAILLIIPPSLALGWVLARRQFPGKSLVETLVALPLVMPPVATGLILLRFLGRRSTVGSFVHEHFGVDIAFTWRGVVVAMAVMSLPLLVRGARHAFESVSPRLEQVARTLGASWPRILWTITLPLAARGILGGLLLAFARALGEFGATIMVAGNIPGRTTTLSVAIFHHVQLGEDPAAMRLLAISIAVAFVAVLLSERFFQRGGAH